MKRLLASVRLLFASVREWLWCFLRRFLRRAGEGFAGLLRFFVRTVIAVLLYTLPVALGLGGMLLIIGKMEPSGEATFLLLLCVVLPVLALRKVHKTRYRWKRWSMSPRRVTKTSSPPAAEIPSVEHQKQEALQALIEDLRR